MNHLTGALTSVRWASLFPWLILVRAARVSLMFRVIALSLAGLVATDLGWRMIERVSEAFGGEGRGIHVRRLNHDVPKPLETRTDKARTVEETHATRPSAVLMLQGRINPLVGELDESPLLRGWIWAAEPILELGEARGLRQWLSLLLAAFWAAIIWALFGGAIARIAAVHLCYGETISPLGALQAAARKWRSTVGAMVISAIAIGIFSLPLILAGLLLRFDASAALTALIWFAVLLSGLVLAVALIGVAAGWPFMWSTVAVERTDAFDAVSRAIGYVYQRPLHLVFHILFACLLGVIAQAAVNLIVDSTLAVTRGAVSFGASDARLLEIDHSVGSRLEGIAADAIDFWTDAFAWIAAGFPMAYLWPAAVGIYLLQRRLIDSTEMTEVKFDQGEPQHGLPPLATDPQTGVPHMGEAPGSPPAL